MLEEALPSIWTSMNSWFTPTVLFLLLNLMIGTIAVTSRIGTQKHHHHHQQQQQQPIEGSQPTLARVPSVLERLKSINLYRYRSQDVDPFLSSSTTTTTTTTILNPPDLETLQTEGPHPIETLIETLIETQEEKHDPHQNTDEENHDHQFSRTKSETIPASGDIPIKLPQKMKRSASEKSAFGHFEEEEIIRRPSTVKEGKKKASALQLFGDDEEVDAKADDFINKFKQQLKLQRLDSILRNKEMRKRDGN